MCVVTLPTPIFQQNIEITILQNIYSSPLYLHSQTTALIYSIAVIDLRQTQYHMNRDYSPTTASIQYTTASIIDKYIQVLVSYAISSCSTIHQLLSIPQWVILLFVFSTVSLRYLIIIKAFTATMVQRARLSKKQLNTTCSK